MSVQPNSDKQNADTTAPPRDDQRAASLARLLPLWPSEIADISPGGRARLVSKLELALRAERRRGKAGNWAYDLGRHVALHAAWRREKSALDALRRAGRE